VVISEQFPRQYLDQGGTNIRVNGDLPPAAHLLKPFKNMIHRRIGIDGLPYRQDEIAAIGGSRDSCVLSRRKKDASA
jgi:hypothetical protein